MQSPQPSRKWSCLANCRWKAATLVSIGLASSCSCVVVGVGVRAIQSVIDRGGIRGIIGTYARSGRPATPPAPTARSVTVDCQPRHRRCCYYCRPALRRPLRPWWVMAPRSDGVMGRLSDVLMKRTQQARCPAPISASACVQLCVRAGSEGERSIASIDGGAARQ